MNCKSFCIDIFVVLTACLDHDFWLGARSKPGISGIHFL
jgi:hypothetical protein